VVCVTGRFFSELCEAETLPTPERWGGTRIELPGGIYTNALTGTTITLADNPDVSSVLPDVPFTLLVRT